MKRHTAILLLLLALPLLAQAADAEFKSVVKAIEKQYGIRGHGLPWFARAILKFDGDARSTHLKLASFENLPRNVDCTSADFDALVRGSLGPNWFRFVLVKSRRDHECTSIYADVSGKAPRLFIASLEPGEGAVVQLTLSDEATKRWMAEPGEMGAREAHSHHSDR